MGMLSLKMKKKCIRIFVSISRQTSLEKGELDLLMKTVQAEPLHHIRINQDLLRSNEDLFDNNEDRLIMLVRSLEEKVEEGEDKD